MANHKSALKRIKQTSVRTERNRAQRSRLRNQIRDLRVALDAKDKAATQTLAPPVFALIDHSVSAGILHRNTAARYKSRLSLRLKSLS
ncbi:MAG: 30S ribosomal protein S20 [Acidobacteriota bacterium]|nr:30S ribosomal protein S20 [Acidobacteriota bacterium]